MLGESVDKRIEEVIERLNKAFIDDCLREDLRKGYASDTNFYLSALHPKFKKVRSWLQKTNQTVYFSILKEIVKKIVEKEIKCLQEEDMRRAIKFENRIISLLNNSKTRVVLSKDIDSPEKIKNLNENLYKKLMAEFTERVSFHSTSKHFSNQVRTILNKEKGIDNIVDLCFIICAEYEKIPIATYDKGISRILFAYNLPRIDMFKDALPYGKDFNWAEIL